MIMQLIFSTTLMGYAMTRRAFKMKLKPGFEEEYKKRHDNIWPELQEVLSEAGVFDYSIFLDRETLTLYAIQKLHDGHQADELPNHPVVKKWWQSMAELMETNADNSPISEMLTEVFHLD